MCITYIEYAREEVEHDHKVLPQSLEAVADDRVEDDDHVAHGVNPEVHVRVIILQLFVCIEVLVCDQYMMKNVKEGKDHKQEQLVFVAVSCEIIIVFGITEAEKTCAHLALFDLLEVVSVGMHAVLKGPFQGIC